jgi:hypothetical protein
MRQPLIVGDFLQHLLNVDGIVEPSMEKAW